jgi:replicative DNA helicase
MTSMTTDRASRQPPPTIDGRPPPNDLDAEAVVLSDILNAPDPRVTLAVIRSILKPDDFYSDANRRIVEACIALDDANKPIDVTTVANWLRNREWWQSVGGADYLNAILFATPAVHNVAAHAEVVRDKAITRRVIQVAQTVAAEGYFDIPNVSVWAAQAASAIDMVARKGSNKRGVTARQATHDLMQRLMNPDDDTSAVFTEIGPIDRFMGPMKPSQVTLVLAYTSCGKSAYCSSVVTNVATTCEQVRCKGKEAANGQPSTEPCGWHGANPWRKKDAKFDEDYRCIKCTGKLAPIAQGVIVFSQEMNPEEYQARILAKYSQVEYERIERGTATPDEWSAFAEAAQACAVDHLRIVDDCSTIEEIVSAAHGIAHEMKRDGYPVRLIVIDYAQRVRAAAASGRRMSREEEVAEVGRTVKELAGKLKVPVLMPGQLNDDARKKGERPSANNARESKALAMDADNVLIIFNSDREKAASNEYNDDRYEAKEHEAVDFIVDKKRGGKKGTIRGAFIPRTTSFCEWNRAWGDPWEERRRQQK